MAPDQLGFQSLVPSECAEDAKQHATGDKKEIWWNLEQNNSAAAQGILLRGMFGIIISL